MKKPFLWGTLILLLGVSFGVLYYFYPSIKASFLLSKAYSAWKEKDYAKAESWVVSAYQSDPSNLRVIGMLGDAALRRGDISAIYWKHQVALRLPDTDAAWFDLASSGIQLEQLEVAEQALTCVKDQGRGDYFSLRGSIAYMQGDMELAMSFFSQALSIIDSELNRFNLATVSAFSNDPKVREVAWSQLKVFLKKESLYLPACRSLILSYHHHGQSEEMLPYLETLKKSEFPADRQLALALWLQTSEEIEDMLHSVNDPAEKLLVSAWLRDRGRLDEALELLLSVKGSKHAGIPLSIAELYLDLGKNQQALQALGQTTGILAELIRWRANFPDQNLNEFKKTMAAYEDSSLYFFPAIDLLKAWDYKLPLESLYLRLITTPHGSDAYQSLLEYYLETDNALAAFQASRIRFNYSESLASWNNYTYLAQVLGLDNKEIHLKIKDLFEKYPQYKEVEANYYLSLRRQNQELPRELKFERIESVFRKPQPRFSKERELIKTLFLEDGVRSSP